MNIFEPLVNAAFNYGKWFISCWIEPKFNFKDFFVAAGLKNKENEYPNLIKSYKGDLGMIYLFSIPIGLNEGDFKKVKEALSIQLKSNIEIRLKNGFIEIETIEKTLQKNIPYKNQRRIKDSIYISIGESLEGPIAVDLKENPHSYIVGTTGSGKSVCTKGILTSLVSNYKPQEVELYLCDLKMVELALFRNLKHTRRFVYTVEDTTEIIADLLEETKSRYNLFMNHGVTSIFEYNKLPNVKKLKFQILFIEEVVILLEDQKKKAMKLLKQLIAINRASGCYVFITTQRPSADIIDNVVKANINNRIVFKVEDEKNSNICLDSPEAKDLRGAGHGILKVGSNKTEFQSYYISDSQVKNLTKPYIETEKKGSYDVLKKEQQKHIIEIDERENSFILSKIENGSPSIDLSFLD